MKKVMKYIAVLLASAALAGCGEEGLETNDLSAPVVVNRFYPTSGGVGTEVIITGRNFSEDPAEVSVRLGKTELKVLNSNATNIVVMIPRKLGSGRFEVSIAGREAVQTLERFSYTYSAEVSTLAGNSESGYADGTGDLARFYFNDYDQAQPEGWRKGAICCDDDCNVYVTDIVNCCIRKIAPDGTVSTFVGMAGQSGTTDGVGTGARLGKLNYGLDCDRDGNLWLVDTGTWQLRRISPSGEVKTVVGCPCEPWYVAVDRTEPGTLYVSGQGTNKGIYRYDMEQNAFSTVATGTTWSAVAAADGVLYASNVDSHSIERFVETADGWSRETLAGSVQGCEDGAFAQARFSWPRGLAIDPSGDLCVAGNGTWDGGENADQGIRRLKMVEGVVETMAGNTTAGYVDAVGAAAAFSGPQDVTVDKNGVIYVFDKMNNAVRKIIYE